MLIIKMSGVEMRRAEGPVQTTPGVWIPPAPVRHEVTLKGQGKQLFPITSRLSSLVHKGCGTQWAQTGNTLQRSCQPGKQAQLSHRLAQASQNLRRAGSSWAHRPLKKVPAALGPSGPTNSLQVA